ncbi:hypothetical protein OH76DRAFT_1395805 [Lentinus brumalis]|uniref:Secreted protein n=1 Tax=Lentinus brumalis TaxID=2498619 RepID=A0A371DVZ1_9APHY|nr:hypothetical protein OH76DRAFT_1395805 [Polyporus brumalis]
MCSCVGRCPTCLPVHGTLQLPCVALLSSALSCSAAAGCLGNKPRVFNNSIASADLLETSLLLISFTCRETRAVLPVSERASTHRDYLHIDHNLTNRLACLSSFLVLRADVIPGAVD